MEESIKLMAAKSCHSDPEKWISFVMHSVDTAGVIEYLFDRWIPESLREYFMINLSEHSNRDDAYNTAVNYCVLLALLHDIGKMTPAFQNKITANISGHKNKLEDSEIYISNISEASKTPHNIAGQVILEECGFSHETAVIAGAHHGRPPQDTFEQLCIYTSNYYGKNDAQKSKWQSLWNSWIELSLQITGFSDVNSVPMPDVKLQMLLTGLLIMADWIASNPQYFPHVSTDENYSEKQYRARIEKGIKALSLPEYLEFQGADDFCELFESRFSTPEIQMYPNAVQCKFMEIAANAAEPGIYILEAPMGIGKTEAALAAAEILGAKFGIGGVYFGLPTQATANGIFGRMYAWADNLSSDGKHTIRLAHGTADLNNEYRSVLHGKAEDSGDENIIVHEWFEGRKQALLSDFVVATVDQFLLASLKQKHIMLRHLGLVGKVVIIDECHAYDSYMNVYLDRTLTWMGFYHVPVIILSATLPPERRTEMLKAYLCYDEHKELTIENPCEPYAYPVITWTEGTVVQQETVTADTNAVNVKISKANLSAAEITALLDDKLSEGGCAAVIVNTVDLAQQLSMEIEKMNPDFTVICFHSRFITTDRAQIENEVFGRAGKNSTVSDRKKLIVVGTQVMEQSLDVDFDFMVTELCPMDLLLQRAGRLHRHNRVRPQKLQQAELVVLLPDEDRRKIIGDLIYAEWILQKTEEFLPESLNLPECIPELVSKVYAKPAPDEENDAWKTFKREKSDKNYRANKYCVESDKLTSRFRNSLEDFLDNDVGSSVEAEASVRDTDETIEVIALQKISGEKYGIISEGNPAEFLITDGLSEEEAKIIAGQKLKLPHFFSKDNKNFKATFNALKSMPDRWKESPWLKNELLLVFDENCRAELLGKTLQYSEKYGLYLLHAENDTDEQV